MTAIIVTVLFTIITATTSYQVDISQNKTSSDYNKSVCGNVYTEKQFILESPNYPKKYPNNSDCTYLIKGPDCPTNFSFQFLDFYIESSRGCYKDRLEIDQLDAICGAKYDIKTYFSKKGTLKLKFVSDNETSERGYRILVSRTACRTENINNTNKVVTVNRRTEDPNFISTSATTLTPNTITPSIHSRNQGFLPRNEECCKNSYNSKTFLLSSPNFPFTFSKPTDCVYKIFKANPKICRLRIHVLFFFLGQSNFYSCPEGFIEIDGKYICGCKSDLKLTTAFSNNNSPKVIRFKTEGSRRNSYSGFILEVIQDECPKKYSPEANMGATKSTEQGFRFYNDQVNRVAWPNDTQESFIQRLQLINERTEILDDTDIEKVYLNQRKNTPKIVKHIYFYAAPEYTDTDDVFVNYRPKEVEETTYIETSSINGVLIDSYNWNECLNWNQMKFSQLYNRFGNNLPKCYDPQVNEVTNSNNYHNNHNNDHHHNQQGHIQSNCIDLNYVRGYFRSPMYPLYYPKYMNLCYRFRRLPGYCAIKVIMNDFQLEYSTNCQKDYFLLGNQYRYCGTSLSNKVWTIDLRQKEFEDARFVTDGFYCARGFSGVYEQIACQDMTNPINPINPTTASPPIYTTFPPPVTPPTPWIPPSTPPTLTPCDALVDDEVFTIDVYASNALMCTYRIKKFTPDVCRLKVYFEEFNLICTSESLLVMDRIFCGRMPGKTLFFDFLEDDDYITITYKRNYNEAIQGRRLRIRGEQISSDCSYPEVPAERLLSMKSNKVTTSQPTLLSNFPILTAESKARYIIAALDRNFKDICGIVTNSTQTQLPPSFCDILTNNNKNITKCIPFAENIISVPYEPSKKVEFEVKPMDKINQIEFNEIDCDDLL